MALLELLKRLSQLAYQIYSLEVELFEVFQRLNFKPTEHCSANSAANIEGSSDHKS